MPIWTWRQQKTRNTKDPSKALESGREAWGTFSLTALRRSHRLPKCWFWTSGLQNCEKLNSWFSATWFMILCQGSPRTQTVLKHPGAPQKRISFPCLALTLSVSEGWWRFSYFVLPLPYSKSLDLMVCSQSTEDLLCRRPQSLRSPLLLKAFSICPWTGDPGQKEGGRTMPSSEWQLPAPTFRSQGKKARLQPLGFRHSPQKWVHLSFNWKAPSSSSTCWGFWKSSRMFFSQNNGSSFGSQCAFSKLFSCQSFPPDRTSLRAATINLCPFLHLAKFSHKVKGNYMLPN